MTGAAMTTPGGVVVIGDGTPKGTTEFHVRKLSAEGESGLVRECARRAHQKAGPAGVFARHAATLAALRESMPAEWREFVRNLTELQDQNARVGDWENAEEYRRSPAGVALEMFRRTRETHAEVPREDYFAAIITDVNAADVHRQIVDAITEKKAPPTPST